MLGVSGEERRKLEVSWRGDEVDREFEGASKSQGY
jgi:hypothetical protein